MPTSKRCSAKKVLLKISQNSQENTCARVSFLIKLQALRPATLLKTLAQVLSCEFCEIFKNNFFYRTPLMAASDQNYLSNDHNSYLKTIDETEYS